MDIGFIGTGSMGAAMVPHLVAAGHAVTVWNRTRAAAEAIASVRVADSPAEAFGGDAVLTMLADDAAVRSVVLDSGALAAARPGLVHVMLATISLPLVEALKAAHAAAGLGYVAAPVFGVPAAAAAKQLNVLAAGDARRRCRASCRCSRRSGARSGPWATIRCAPTSSSSAAI